MNPVNFEDMNCIFKAEGCGDLPALKIDKHIVQCWEMTEKEKEEFIKTGKIYLSVLGNIQPPVALYIDRPYIRQQKGEKMGKPVQRKRYKIKQNVTCEQCINCMYIEHGDMYCDEKEDMPLVYDEFCPTENYMWCNGRKFNERQEHL